MHPRKQPAGTMANIHYSGSRLLPVWCY